MKNKRSKIIVAIIIMIVICMMLPTLVVAEGNTVSGTKYWKNTEEENLPEITIQLYHNDEPVEGKLKTLSNENGWNYSFSDIEADGTYSVKEVGEINGSITIDNKIYNVSYGDTNAISVGFGVKETEANVDTYPLTGNLIVAKKGGNYFI